RAEEVSADADVVANVEQLVELETLVADGVLADVDLEAHTALLKLREPRLALLANGHYAPRDGDAGARGFEVFGGGVVVAAANGRQRMRGRKRVGIGALAQRLNLLQLIFAER